MPAGQVTRPVALITGGAKRVGRAIVERLGAAGFDVVFTYLTSRREASELQEKLESAGRRCMAVQVDLTDPTAAKDLIHRSLTSRFDRLDVLVNNASLYEPGELAQVTVEQMRRLTAVHVESPLLLSQTFAPLLRQSKGRIINMADLMAERPWPKYLAYCVSKAGLASLTVALARALAPDVTVNAIAPGVVEWADEFPPSARAQYLKRVPLARAGTPQDVAELVHFLCTSGSYITGQVIHLDGGRSIT